MEIDHPLTFSALLVAFLGLVYFSISRDVRGKGIAKLVVPAAVALGSVAFLIPNAANAGTMWLGALVSILGPYVLYRQLVYCRNCGNSGSIFSPLTRKDTKCSKCGSPLGKPPNTSLERTRER